MQYAYYKKYNAAKPPSAFEGSGLVLQLQICTTKVKVTYKFTNTAMTVLFNAHKVLKLEEPLY